MSNNSEGGRNRNLDIQLAPNIIKMASEMAGDLVEGEIKEMQFGEKAGKVFVSLEKDGLVEPQTVEAENKTVYVSLWKK